MQYQIGKIASLMGISIEGLRKYENAGLITPSRTEDSKYRKYSYLDFTSLIRTRCYRALGFSVREIVTLTNDAGIDETAEILREKRERLGEEHRITEAKIALLDEMTAEIEGIDQRLNQIEIGVCPAFFRLEFSRNGEIYEEKETLKTFQKMMDAAPFVYISSRYHDDDVFGGIAIDEKYAKLFDIAEQGGICYHPAALCLSMTVAEYENGYSDAHCVSALTEFAREHRFKAETDMIGHTVTGINKKTAYRRYRKVFVRISY